MKVNIHNLMLILKRSNTSYFNYFALLKHSQLTKSIPVQDCTIGKTLTVLCTSTQNTEHTELKTLQQLTPQSKQLNQVFHR